MDEGRQELIRRARNEGVPSGLASLILAIRKWIGPSSIENGRVGLAIATEPGRV